MIEKVKGTVSLSGAETTQAALFSPSPMCSTEAIVDPTSAARHDKLLAHDLQQEITQFEVYT